MVFSGKGKGMQCICYVTLLLIEGSIFSVEKKKKHINIVEGDSELVTNILRKLQQGIPWEKITQLENSHSHSGSRPIDTANPISTPRPHQTERQYNNRLSS